jgi:hypothetical protein
MLDPRVDGRTFFSFTDVKFAQGVARVKYFKVTFKDGKSVTIEKPDDVTEDALRVLWKEGKNLELNEVVYRTEQIAGLAEVKPRIPRAIN